MPRSISVVRRRAGVVDLTVRRRPGKIGFRFSAASNFDKAFTNFQDVLNHGYRSPTAPELGAIGSQFKDEVRFLFNPADYTPTVPHVRDTTPFFIRISAMNPDGSFDPPEAMHVILPYSSDPHRSMLLAGTVPTGFNIHDSVEIQLPMQCNDWEIQNDGGADAYLAWERGPTGSTGAPEFRLQPVTTAFKNVEQIYTSVSQVFIRGAGGTTVISAIFTLRNNPVGH